ncbi:MAG TPA: RDD family protein [Bryobacteraceae bacterium]|nr:RDD family protein [Bryobacteraceae bacterium]
MNCRYCGASNTEDEHRCRRCGRRIVPGVPEPQRFAAVPAPRPAPPGPLQSPPPPVRRAVPHQQALFADAAPAGPRVIPFDSHAPGARQAPRPGNPPLPAAARAPRTEAPKRPPARPPSQAQRSLEFLPPAPPAPSARRTSVESSIYCDARVAPLGQRISAAVLDVFVVLAGFVLMLSVFAYHTGGLVAGRAAYIIYGLAFALLLLFYKYASFRWAGITPGTRWAGLRLLDFDGRPPARRDRLNRLAAGCLSLLPAGAGLLWAIVDEERLTWHDHMSKTFVTPAVRRPS